MRLFAVRSWISFLGVFLVFFPPFHEHCCSQAFRGGEVSNPQQSMETEFQRWIPVAGLSPNNMEQLLEKLQRQELRSPSPSIVPRKPVESSSNLGRRAEEFVKNLTPSQKEQVKKLAQQYRDTGVSPFTKEDLSLLPPELVRELRSSQAIQDLVREMEQDQSASSRANAAGSENPENELSAGIANGQKRDANNNTLKSNATRDESITSNGEKSGNDKKTGPGLPAGDSSKTSNQQPQMGIQDPSARVPGSQSQFPSANSATEEESKPYAVSSERVSSASTSLTNPPRPSDSITNPGNETKATLRQSNVANDSASRGTDRKGNSEPAWSKRPGVPSTSNSAPSTSSPRSSLSPSTQPSVDKVSPQRQEAAQTNRSSTGETAVQKLQRKVGELGIGKLLEKISKEAIGLEKEQTGNSPKPSSQSMSPSREQSASKRADLFEEKKPVERGRAPTEVPQSTKLSNTRVNTSNRAVSSDSTTVSSRSESALRSNEPTFEFPKLDELPPLSYRHLLILLGFAGMFLAFWFFTRDSKVLKKLVSGKATKSSTHNIQVDGIRNRRDVIRVFHKLIEQHFKSFEDWWTSRRAVLQASGHPSLESPIQSAARVYEIARYTPEQSTLSEDDLQAMRMAVSQCNAQEVSR